MIPMPTESEPVTVIEGDCIDVLRQLPDGCVDAVVTDPPYGLEFMGKEWDSFRGNAWRTGAGFSNPGIGKRPTPWPSFGAGDSANATCKTCGGRMRGAKKCECAEPDWWVKGEPLSKRNGRTEQGRSFQVWCDGWMTDVLRVLKPGGYMLALGGTRTFHRLACAMEDAGFEMRDCLMWIYGSGFPKGNGCLKPAYEPILLARKPGQKVLSLGVDECRIDFASADDEAESKTKNQHGDFGSGPMTNQIYGRFDKDRENYNPTGRWPANVVHDGSEEVLAAFAEFGDDKGGNFPARRRGIGYTENGAGKNAGTFGGARNMGMGSAARFFYAAKASRSERGDGNNHPTVKPLSLVRWLVRLVCPTFGVVLDPFGGSGTTGYACHDESRRCILIEKEPAYVEICRRRIAEAMGRGPGSLFKGVV